MKKRVITNIVSRSFGKFASHRFHPVLQKFINISYVKLMKLDMSEFKKPKEYRSLNELFTRSLVKKRVIDIADESIISPVDSLITECGRLESDRLLQIKGMEYSVKELLKEISAQNINRILDGEYINFYLSPRDYHRYHVPCDMQVRKAVHIPGRLYPVNLRFLKKKLNLFVENERVILECLNKEGVLFYIVLVGALNVGEMVLTFEERIRTNLDPDIKVYEYEDLWLKRGELFGYFKMGSTIVMLFEKESVELRVKSKDRVKYGIEVAKFKKG
ncbi:phosphatidylserine decarboxylase [Nitrosophilus alvini]|uniref:phosphatidylserine decarboxylase n=1 Tax=Nitrosophilus alvini TaxID=2714855 RepID=UPI00190D9D9C|nr:phosphatidylserine decarboxylase [Nitrosophilus alvini]